MTLAHAPDAAHQAPERSPDSGNLVVSLNTTHESGIPPARERLARRTDADAAIDQLELVLVESTRAEANLGLLVRGLKHLSAGAAAAQEANAVLVQELDALRSRMSKVHERESLLQQRVQTLESALDVAARERESWLVQEDAFLAGLLDEHEQKLFDVERQHERKMAELDLAFDELRRQHDNVRTDVLRLTYERDAAVALLNEPLEGSEGALGSLSPLPAPSASGTRLASVKLGKLAVKSSPEASTRPLAGYSMAGDELEEDMEEALLSQRATSRPPRP